MSDDRCESCPVEPGLPCLLRQRGQCHHAAREASVLARRPYAETPYRRRAIEHAGGIGSDGLDAEILLVLPGREPPSGLLVDSERSLDPLRRLGRPAAAVRADGAAAIRRALTPGTTTTAILQGIFLSPSALVALADEFPGVRWVVRCHSGLAWLWCEPDVLGQLREIAEAGRENLLVSGVSGRFARWFREAIGRPCVHLPNLYDPGEAPDARSPADPIDACSFGGDRPQKHHAVAAGAAAVLARRTGRAVRFHFNPAGASERTIRAACGIAEPVPCPWLDHAGHLSRCRSMSLGFQLSSTETFNIVTADLASVGVPSVVGEAIDWMPRDMVAPIDDAEAAASVALRLLADPSAGDRAWRALAARQAAAESAWREFLGPPPTTARSAPRPPARRMLAEAASARLCVHREPCGCNAIDCAIRGRAPASACLACPDREPPA